MEPDLKYFEELKKEVTATFQKSHPHCKSEIGEWKGQDIVDFQEELIDKVGGRISEKWFYTHIKSPASKLPRIDMLNMLSEYAGYKNWNDFLGIKQVKPIVNPDVTSNETKNIPEKTNQSVIKEKINKKAQGNKYLLFSGAFILLLLIILKIIPSKDHIYKCCFVDIDGNTSIKTGVRIMVLKEGESPVYAETSNGCIELIEKNNKIKFVIATPYFRPDTFTRVLYNETTKDIIQLKADDYALMIHYFSTSNIKDWERRRMQLSNMISENAKIFQVFGNSGMELYNQQEFIDKMTMPLKSLRNIEILDVKYLEDKIIELRFTQSEKSK